MTPIFPLWMRRIWTGLMLCRTKWQSLQERVKMRFKKMMNPSLTRPGLKRVHGPGGTMEKIWRTHSWSSTTGRMTSWCSMEHVVKTLGTERRREKELQ